jgi:hypothetical protein
MVEDFFKHIELVSLMEKSSEGATYVFLDQMLSWSKAPIEVLIDQGRDF